MWLTSWRRVDKYDDEEYYHIMATRTCLRCGHEWESRNILPPKSCPACKSYRWNVAKELPAEKVKQIEKEADEIRGKKPEPKKHWEDDNGGDVA